MATIAAQTWSGLHNLAWRRLQPASKNTHEAEGSVYLMLASSRGDRATISIVYHQNGSRYLVHQHHVLLSSHLALDGWMLTASRQQVHKECWGVVQTHLLVVERQAVKDTAQSWMSRSNGSCSPSLRDQRELCLPQEGICWRRVG